MELSGTLHRLSPFGPIFGKELRTTSRRKRSYVLRVVYLTLLLLVLLMAYSITTSLRGASGVAQRVQEQARLGEIFFAIFEIFSIWTMGLIGPILTATAIGSERLHKTLPVLLMTPISAWQIVCGKLFSRLLVALTLLGLSLPVLALVRLLGGVELQQMFRVLYIAVVAAISTAAIGLFFSALLNRAYAVILLSYATMFVLYVFVPIVVVLRIGAGGPGAMMGAMWAMRFLAATNPYFLAMVESEPMFTGGIAALPWVWCMIGHLCLTVVLLVLSAMILRRAARRAGEHSGGSPARGVAVFAPAPLAPPPLPAAPVSGAPASPPPLSAERQAVPLMYQTPARRDRRAREVSDNPVLWREIRRPLMPKRWQAIAGAIITVALLVVLYIVLANSGRGMLAESSSQAMFAVIFNFLTWVVATVLAATAIAHEKESDTWTLLMVSPISGKTIVWGKAAGVLRRMMWPFLLIAGHFLAFTVAGVLNFPVAAMVLWVILTFNSIWIATGVYLSLRFRKVSIAVIVNLMLAIVAYAIVPTILAVIESLFHRRHLTEQVEWYLPYYFLGEGLDKLGTKHFRGMYFSRPWLPGGDVSGNMFLLYVFLIGCVHLLLAGFILSRTSSRFNRIVGRAAQKHRLSPDMPPISTVAG